MSSKQKPWDFELAEDVQVMMEELVERLELTHIQTKNVFCVRSGGSKARAYARIWGLSRIFQVTAGFSPTYVIEVLTQHFDKLDDERKQKVIIHELLHIPKTFSGALKSHNSRHYQVNDKEVDKLFAMMKNEK